MKKTAIVTGAAGGIGFATAMQLASEGFCVTAMDVAPFERVKGKFVQADVMYIEGNLTSAEDRQNVLKATIQRFGRVDVLVNVAGVAPLERMDLLEMTEESYDRVMAINTKGTLFMTQLVANQMLSQETDDIRGTIVNISSMSAYTSSTSRGEYCISKAGVSMLTKLFADRLAGDGVLVYEVRPGIIATGMTSAVQGKYDALIADGLLPIKRWGMPQDVADSVSVLCSGRLRYCTGDIINVDGGFHLRRL